MTTATATPLAVKRGFFVPEDTDIQVTGYFYAVDMGEGVAPCHHRVGKNAVCTCYLGENCPAVDMVRAYLANGGERAPEPPIGYYPVAPAKCPICGSIAVFEKSLCSKKRGAGWRCESGGTAHYWQRMGQALADKFAANPWLFPPVVMREGQRVVAWDGIIQNDQVLYAGLRRSEIVDATYPGEPND